MIAEFIASFDLFRDAYLTGWLVAALLGLIGVVAVARDQIFLGAAVAEASTLGIAVLMSIGFWLAPETPEWLESPWVESFAAVSFSLMAAFLTERGGRAEGQSHEALLGWIFLVGGAGSVLLVSKSPHGLEEIHRVVASSLIGAEPIDVKILGTLFIAVAVPTVFFSRSILLYALDPDTAEAIGVPVRLWRFLVALTLGLSVGFAIRVSGLLYTFGCLVLPALVAKRLCREIRTMFIMAPLIAVLTALAAFVVANHHDLPPAQLTVVFLALLLVPVYYVGKLRRAA